MGEETHPVKSGGFNPPADGAVPTEGGENSSMHILELSDGVLAEEESGGGLRHESWRGKRYTRGGRTAPWWVAVVESSGGSSLGGFLQFTFIAEGLFAVSAGRRHAFLSGEEQVGTTTSGRTLSGLHRVTKWDATRRTVRVFGLERKFFERIVWCST